MSIEGKIQENHPLGRYCTFQIGGAADFFLEADSVEALLAGLEWAEARDMPVFVFGGGSNILFDDAGFRGLVIRVRAEGVQVDGECIEAEAGARSAAVVKAAAEAGLTGLEAWNGLPGTVGGAVYGNAGCFEVETVDVLEWAELYRPGEGVQRVSVQELNYDYRDSRLKREPAVVLRTRFRLSRGERGAIETRMRDVARLRIQKQPPGLTTGSFFKNPRLPEEHAQHGRSAGWLIDQCGLKGEGVGGAQISQHHANFLMNTGGATASDVLALGETAAAAVKQRFGVELEREIIYVSP